VRVFLALFLVVEKIVGRDRAGRCRWSSNDYDARLPGSSPSRSTANSDASSRPESRVAITSACDSGRAEPKITRVPSAFTATSRPNTVTIRELPDAAVRNEGLVLRDPELIGRVIFVIVAIEVVASLVALVWAVQDAKARGKSRLLPAILILVFQIAGLFFWLAIRPPKKNKPGESDAP
jgi:hypothetical protein